MEIKKYFKNRKKFVDLSDPEEYNELQNKMNFLKERETSPLFLNEFNKEKKQ